MPASGHVVRTSGLKVRALAIIGALILGILGAPGIGRATVPTPTLSIPPAGLYGHALWDSWFDLSPLGFQEQEYFVSGTAKSLNGATTANYTTRIIVTRPSNQANFNGTVLLDWTNVTAQFENAVDTLEAHEMLLREGFAFVHVSAQSAGICCTPLTPKVWDPVRYAALSHPGDTYAYDMFSQIAQALRTHPALDPMSGLTVERVLAAGQSQSAGTLQTYVNQVQASAGVIDGFLIHGGGSKTYSGPPPLVPVLHLLSDNEASSSSPSTTTNYQLWEIAGTAHSDFWLGYHQVFGQGPRSLGHAPKVSSEAKASLTNTAGNYGEQIHPMLATCVLAGATMPMHYATSSAIHYLNRWVATGERPPAGNRFQFNGGSLARDGNGNALGGIRMPPIDVPVARYESTRCPLGGVTVPFSEAQLRQLYSSHAAYYSMMQQKTADSVANGFLLPEDAADLLSRACASKNRWQELPGSCD